MSSFLITLTVNLLLVSHALTQTTVAEDSNAVFCYCDSGSNCDASTNTCQLTADTETSAFIQCGVDYNVESGELRHLCLKAFLHCKSSSKVLRTCCEDESQCNKCLLPEALSHHQCLDLSLPPGCPPINCTQYMRETEKDTEDAGLEWYWIIVIVLLLVVVIIVTLLIGIVFCIYRKRIQQVYASGKYDISLYDGSFSESGRGDASSGGFTIGGGALLDQRTISSEITLEECIGSGGFGNVYIASHHKQKVAVKIFKNKNKQDAESYERERVMYSSRVLSHPNITVYLAADIKFNKSYGEAELWLVMEYYPLGCLSDYCIKNTLELAQVMKIFLSIAGALDYLHHPHHTHYGITHSIIAHRDLKARNVLVKSELGDCVLADFGLSLTEKDFEEDTNPVKIPVGTKRYMAPEILSNEINSKEIVSFCKTDIYSFGLMMWEVLQRAEIDGCAGEYSVPFQNFLSNNPSLEEVYKVVVEQRLKPELDKRWKNNEILYQSIVSLMQECWSSSPEARPTATRLKRKLDSFLPAMKIAC